MLTPGHTPTPASEHHKYQSAIVLHGFQKLTLWEIWLCFPVLTVSSGLCFPWKEIQWNDESGNTGRDPYGGCPDFLKCFKESEINRAAKSDRPLVVLSNRPIPVVWSGRSGFNAKGEWIEIEEEIFRYFFTSLQTNNVLYTIMLFLMEFSWSILLMKGRELSLLGWHDRDSRSIHRESFLFIN